MMTPWYPSSSRSVPCTTFGEERVTAGSVDRVDQHVSDHNHAWIIGQEVAEGGEIHVLQLAHGARVYGQRLVRVQHDAADCPANVSACR